MSDQDLFNSNNGNPNPDNIQTGDTNTPPASNDPLADLLASITNPEGKPKYDSVDKALKALKDSQDYIARLEAEKKAEREELERLKALEDQRESVEDVVNRLLAAKNEPAKPQETPQVPGSVDVNAVQKLVQDALEADRLRNLAEQNAKAVTTALMQKFGDKAGEAIAAKAAELGTTPEALGALAKQNPKMVLAYFNTTVAPKATSTTSSVNLPLTDNKELQRPTLEKSILQGATSRDQTDAFRRSREFTNKRLGVTGN
jgi:hypothetical protein